MVYACFGLAVLILWIAGVAGGSMASQIADYGKNRRPRKVSGEVLGATVSDSPVNEKGDQNVS